MLVKFRANQRKSQPSAGLATQTAIWVARLGLAAVLFSQLTACAPGVIDCNVFPCDQSGGGGGGGPGGDGSGGGGSGGMPGNETPVADCAEFATVGAIESNFLSMKCGSKESACHNSKAVWGNFETLPLYNKLISRKSVVACSGTLVVDPADPSKSILLTKLEDKPACTGAAEGAGERMPLTTTADPRPLLTPAEKTCLTNYVKAITSR